MDLYEVLNKLKINYEEVEHEPVFTAEQAQIIKNRIKGIGCKNLFLTDKKNKYFLVIIEDHKKANIKEIERITASSHLSFANDEELREILSLKQGSVTPFGIINDFEKKVELVIDDDLKDKKLLFHPNINTKTISILCNDLIKFIEFEQHNYIFIP